MGRQYFYTGGESDPSIRTPFLPKTKLKAAHLLKRRRS
jgi:hypothetical protein